MACLTELQITTIQNALANPTKSVSTDGLTVTNQSTGDLIRLLQYSQTCEVAENPGQTPFRINYLFSPGMIHGVGRKTTS